MSKTAKKIIIAIVCAVIVVGAGASFIVSKEKAKANQNVEIYQTAKVEKGELKVSVSSSGIVVPENKTNPDYDDLEFELTVDEIDVVNLKENQTVNIDLNAFPDKTFKGKIESISDIGNTVNGVTTYTVVVSFDKNIKGLKAGMTGTGTITTEKKDDILYVPIEAINQDDSGKNYVIIPSTNEKKFVTTGIHNDDYIQIKQGLSNGDEVQLPTLVNNKNTGFPMMDN